MFHISVQNCRWVVLYLTTPSSTLPTNNELESFRLVNEMHYCHIL